MNRLRSAATVSILGLALLTACSSGSTTEPQEGETLTVFAAASLQEAFDDLLGEFAADHPAATMVPAVYDGSSTLVTQLIEGASADVLATANESTMAHAEEAGVMTSTPELFASNDLVIAVPKDNPHGVTDLPDVLGLDYAVCAVQVPCGEATAALFDAAGLSVDPISEEQNVTAVANRVSAGEVDAGFIYSTDVAARPELLGISPQAAQIINHYPVGTTSDSEIGAAFVEFVLSERGAEVLARYGFGQP